MPVLMSGASLDRKAGGNWVSEVLQQGLCMHTAEVTGGPVKIMLCGICRFLKIMHSYRLYWEHL